MESTPQKSIPQGDSHNQACDTHTLSSPHCVSNEHTVLLSIISFSDYDSIDTQDVSCCLRLIIMKPIIHYCKRSKNLFNVVQFTLCVTLYLAAARWCSG